jgi:amino acid transporter
MSTEPKKQPASKPETSKPETSKPETKAGSPAPDEHIPGEAPLPPGVPLEEGPTWVSRLRRTVFGAPRDVQEKGIFHALSLIPFLAWVGLGADGLSSSSYGPEEAFKTLGTHTYLSLGIAVAMALTVVIIAAAYSRIIEQFPHGGGGYVVATKLLGERAGVISGCALIVDYVLTITVSIAAAGDALFSFIPQDYFTLHLSTLGTVHFEWAAVKFVVEIGLIIFLTALNIRGVRESVIVLTPIFILFLITHTVLLGGAFFTSVPKVPALAAQVTGGFKEGLATLGMLGMVKLFIHAYSLGGGTYTGLEAVSNGLPIMREPRVQTAKRTMLYMAASLAICAAGLLICYLLVGATPKEGMTMNAVLLEKLCGNGLGGRIFTVVTLIAEGALLIVGAQAGFVDGPRVMANMAVDSWMPKRLSALSDRLTTQNGIVLMGIASLAALLYTHGNVGTLVVMYSINVFLTFSLSMFGMLKRIVQRSHSSDHSGHMLLFLVGFLMCATILVVTVVEKFLEGGWITLLVTAICVVLCFLIRIHYDAVSVRLKALDAALGDLPPIPDVKPLMVHKNQATAVVLVASYGGLGLHTVLNIFKSFPGYFKNIVFVSVGVIDSGGFKGEEEVEALRQRTDENLQKYVEFAHRMGMPAEARSAIGTDAVADVEELCAAVAKEFTRATFFAGQIIFHRERWYDRWLHNQTAFSIQKRLQWAGMAMVILPVRVR